MEVGKANGKGKTGGITSFVIYNSGTVKTTQIKEFLFKGSLEFQTPDWHLPSFQEEIRSPSRDDHVNQRLTLIPTKLVG